MVISYPIPPYQNLPIEPQFYQPSAFFISNVALGIMTTVTTSVDHNYVVGQLVRLLIPETYGSRGLNESQGYVVSIPASNQVLLNINSSNNVNPFVNSGQPTKPQILAIGDVNTGVTNTGRSNNGTYIPGSFIDIS